MTVKGELRKVVIACGGAPTKNTIPGLIGEIAVAIGGTGTGKTVAEQLHNIALAKGFPADGTWTVTYNTNGGTGSIDAVEVNAGDSITLNSGSTLTAPEGKEFVGWAKSSSAQSATVTSPFTPTKDETLYAVWGDVTPAEEPTT